VDTRASAGPGIGFRDRGGDPDGCYRASLGPDADRDLGTRE
jgi:hypothetical protein